MIALLVLALLFGFVLGFHVCNLVLARPAIGIARRVATTNSECIAAMKKLLDFYDIRLSEQIRESAKSTNRTVN